MEYTDNFGIALAINRDHLILQLLSGWFRHVRTLQ